MSANEKTPDQEYKRLFKSGVSAYKKGDHKTSYNCFSTIANGNSKYKYDAIFYLARQHEVGLEISKNYSKAFDLYSQVSNNVSNYKYDAIIWLALHFENKNDHQKAFEYFLYIYHGEPQKFKEIELLLADRVKEGLAHFKDDKRAFEFYSHLYTNIPEYKSFARNSLIKCYMFGIGVKKNEEKAYKLENEALK
ncbi:Beta-lactamase HcpA precursor [Gigaspora margarita]|uniref:Beta-lactamase HcpA n=1 Tax=Gigaspora margarita TaxID=4874 RepID=A0A8H4AVB5_GIGMA|nr:Beta-lactamase HcpA precursor [Gigaspora margarita]